MAKGKCKKRKNSSLYDSDQEFLGNDFSDDGLGCTFLSCNRDQYNGEYDLQKYLDSITYFISTFCFVPQLVGIIPPVIQKSGADTPPKSMYPCNGVNNDKSL